MWPALFRKKKAERDLNDEFQQYIAEAIKDKIANGMSSEEAQREALIEFGGVEQVKEVMRQSRRGAWLEALLRDIAFAFRIFRKNPSFAVLALLTSALGIAAATASFSAVDAVLLRPLPYKKSDRLVQIWGTLPVLRNDPALSAIWDQFNPGYDGYKEFLQRQKVFERVGAFLIENASILEPGEPRHVSVGKAEAGLFQFLGVPALRGRLISESDEKGDAPPIAVLAYDMWMRDFGGDPNVLGRRIIIQPSRSGSPAREEYTIAGILPQGFRLPVHDADKRTVADMWTPFWNKGIPTSPSQDFEMLGYVKPGVPIAQAENETAVIFSQLPPDPSWPKELHMTLGGRVVRWREQEAAPLRKSVLLVFAASGLLLLIACGNVANLLLDRAVGRQHEITLRSVLGASRARIMGQLIVESAVLSSLGGLLGAAFATLLVRAVVKVLPIDAPYGGLTIDARVLLFAISASIVTGVLFGMLPAVAGTRAQLHSSLKDSATNRGSQRNRIQRLTIVAEISLSCVLLIAAGLITRSLLRLTAIDPGFRSEQLLTVKLRLPPSRYGDAKRIESFYQDLLPRLGSLPGVTGITARQGTQFTDYHSVGVSGDVVPEGAQPGTPPPAIESRAVLPNYFEFLGAGRVEGRFFTNEDAASGRKPVFIVNKAMARTFWPGHSAINRRLGDGVVVGVVDNPKEFSLGEQPQPVYYIPTLPNQEAMTVLIRTAVEPASIASTIRREVRGIDPDLPVDRIETMQNLIAASNAGQRNRTILIGVFAGAAVLLVLIGLYGVISRSVSQRTRELGIRIAIGADPREMLWLVLRQSLNLALAGVLIGCAVALAATRLITSFLFGITATDISTYAMIAASVVALSLAATYLPARRASRIDPAECLRAE